MWLLNKTIKFTIKILLQAKCEQFALFSKGFFFRKVCKMKTLNCLKGFSFARSLKEAFKVCIQL